MNKNRGLTLVELLIVVLIIGIIAGFTGVAASTSGSSSAKKSATMIDSYIGELRINCMSRAGSPYAELYVNEDGELAAEYYEGNTLVSEETLSDKRVSVSYKAGDEDVTALKDAEEGFEISFARSTGALKKPDIDGELKISVSGGSKSYTLSIVAVTGSYSMEQEAVDEKQ